MRRRRSLSALVSFRRPLPVLIRVKRPASRTVTMGSSATGRASDRRRWTSDIGLTATAPLSQYPDINASGTGIVAERACDGSPRYWAARGCHRKMWNPAGDILWIVVGDRPLSPGVGASYRPEPTAIGSLGGAFMNPAQLARPYGAPDPN